jgi:hypothetical protein
MMPSAVRDAVAQMSSGDRYAPFGDVAFLVDQIVGAVDEFFGFWSLGNVSYNDFGAFCSCPFAELQVNA